MGAAATEEPAPAKKGKKEAAAKEEEASAKKGKKEAAAKEEEAPAKKGKKEAAAKEEEAPDKKGKKESPKKLEEDLVAQRTKELKGMLAADIKELLLSKGLEKGTKADMIETLLAFEAKAREQARAKADKVQEIESKLKADISSKSL